MEVIQEDNPHEELLNQISLKEAERFERIFNRFCWLKGVAIDIAMVETVEPPDKPNYWEYWYISAKLKGFLMSRELKVVDGAPILEVKFNPILLDESKIN